MRDSDVCNLWKVGTFKNESDLLTKIHEPSQFARLRHCCMVYSRRFRRVSLPALRLRRRRSILLLAGDAARTHAPGQLPGPGFWPERSGRIAGLWRSRQVNGNSGDTGPEKEQMR